MLTIGGSFRDAETEARFREKELVAMRPMLSILVPGLGLAFACFALPDYLVLGMGADFLIAAAARALFLVTCLIATPGLLRGGGFRKHTFRKHAERLVTMVSVTGATAFSVILFLYRNGNYYLQAMSVLIMIAGLFLMPNRLRVSCALAGLIAGSGLASIPFLESGLESQEIPAIFVDYALATAVGLVAAWRTAQARRLEFAHAEELERISGTDPLTGLANRRAFERCMNELLEKNRACGGRASLGVLDLDNLKPVNDRYGHEAGDAVLRETAGCLKTMLGASGYAARWGGDEMVFLVKDSGLEKASVLAEAIRKAFEAMRLEQGIRVTASFGITVLEPNDDPKSAVARADKALYKAKASGRNRVET